MPAKIAPKSSLLVAKFAGRCSCGAKVQAGTEIAWSRSYDHPIVGCAACSFGTFPGATVESLTLHATGCMALANNAMNMRARGDSVGRLLTQIDLAAAARAAL